jgi:hypothetical protein
MIKIKSTRDLGPQLINNSHQMVGQDGAYSISLGDKTLWFFGDTLIGERIPGGSVWYPNGQAVGPWDMSGKGSIRRMINNTALLTGIKTGRNGLINFKYICEPNGELKQLILLESHEHPDQSRIWCMHGIRIDKKIYLAFIKVRMIEEGPFPVNFEIVGSGLSVGSSNDWNFRRVAHDSGDLFWKENEPQFGSAFLLDPQIDWVYLYGIKKTQAGVQQCYISRVIQENIEDRKSFQFLSDTTPSWSSDINDAIPIFNGPPNELSISFNAYLNTYLAVHSLNLTGKIVARTAPNPWGPWSDPIELWHAVPIKKQPLPYPTLIYAGKEHPSLSEEKGRVIYLTYVEFEEYFPHLIEVEFK